MSLTLFFESLIMQHYTFTYWFKRAFSGVTYEERKNSSEHFCFAKFLKFLFFFFLRKKRKKKEGVEVLKKFAFRCHELR